MQSSVLLVPIALPALHSQFLELSHLVSGSASQLSYLKQAATVTMFGQTRQQTLLVELKQVSTTWIEAPHIKAQSCHLACSCRGGLLCAKPSAA